MSMDYSNQLGEQLIMSTLGHVDGVQDEVTYVIADMGYHRRQPELNFDNFIASDIWGHIRGVVYDRFR